MYLKATKGILTNLLYVSPTRHLLYVTDLSSPSQPSHKLEHLSCFLPGLFALGAHLLDLPPRVKEQHQWVAEGLATTCYFQYADQASGLGPDESTFVSEGSRKWIELLAEWERDGKKGGVPPGMGRETKVVTKAGEKDYSLRNSGYFLRPEVCLLLCCYEWKTG
jgi:mannosyl-oligosaccharide alpha-1,2-mannosidase